ncbi:MAG: M1 family metallopeptidase [Acidobacteria bacterium]|nr:M1 family metallopeptidase [Acidobacteriota bacterium]
MVSGGLGLTLNPVVPHTVIASFFFRESDLSTIRVLSVVLLCIAGAGSVFAQAPATVRSPREDKFRQLEEILPTPNTYRTGSGAPGHQYWQQRADYVIDVSLDDDKQRINATETITYKNNSPDTLTYLWLQLDQNMLAKGSDAQLTSTASTLERVPFDQVDSMLARTTFEGGHVIGSVKDAKGQPLNSTVVKTMMRVDLREPLVAGGVVTFSVAWSYNINDARKIRSRSGYERFEKDGNCLYAIAQWFPRMAPYTDSTGWQHKQFLGSGEFSLEFGDYLVRLTVPNDHIVAATGVLQNPEAVLTPTQRQRLKQAETAEKPVLVVTPDEAKAAEAAKPTGTKTWVFKAENVRDFAFASSRKFIWDARRHDVGGNRVLAMSFYPKEGNPLWGQYSTAAITHTLDVYSRYTFTYPYPVAISVNAPVGGMEYPMICFNGPRPEEDGTYSARTKYGLISVVIHEVGHNYFPMIVNTDERQWTWMDEGLNTFLQYLSEREWDTAYPSGRGEPRDIVEYMASTDQVPIMTNSESLLQFGNNAYAKPATALNILRETVLGRDLFDKAFKEYARRWKFKRPMPADFFRTMEDASGVDLDWFWRGWFYTTDSVDVSIERVRHFTIDTRNPDVENPARKAEEDAEPESLSAQRNKALPKAVDRDPSLKDFYNSYDRYAVTPRDREAYQKFVAGLTPREKELLQSGLNFYVIDLHNIGGLVMPVILKIDYTDGTSEEVRIPAEIWRYNPLDVSKLIMTSKELKSVTLDPHLETADVDLENNAFPRRPVKSRFQLFKFENRQPNPMQLLEAKPGAGADAVKKP